MNSDTYITSFVAKLVSNTSVTLSWSGKFNTVTIRSSINNVNYNTIVENYSGTSYTINGLEENMFYYINIIPYDENHNAGISDVLHVITNYNPHITRVTTGTATDTIIPLSWSGVYYNIGLTYNRTGSTKYNVIYPISGTSSYTVTGLDASTSYVFQVTPYDINDISGPSYTISASTDYVSYINKVNLGAITARSVDISCAGLFSFLNFQYSRDNTHWTTAALMNTGISSQDNYQYLLLDPSSIYYFRVYPYSFNFNSGAISSPLIGRTLAGFNSIVVDKIWNEQIDISLNGRYSSFNTYISSNAENYSYFSTVNAPTTTDYIYKTETSITGLTPFTEYYFYFQPYNQSIYGTSSEIFNVRTDYYAQAHVTIGNITTNSINLNFDTSNIPWPYYHHSLIKISEDSETYYDLSMIYSVPTAGNSVIYNATNFNSDALRANYTYYFMVNPYSHMGTKSPYVYYVSHSTLGNIEANAITYGLDENVILFIWSGYYKSTLIEYSTDNFAETAPVNNVIVKRDETISPMEKDIITTFYYFNDLSPATTYYFRLTPINYDGDYGKTSDVHYNPTINTIYISDISSGYVVLNWAGTYGNVTIQSSIDNIRFKSYQTGITDTSMVVIADGYTTTYYQIIPYNNYGESGLISNTTYNPTIISIATTIIDSSGLLLSWNGYYDYVIINYSRNNSDYNYVYTNPDDNTSNVIYSYQTALFITPRIIPGFDTSYDTFYFNISPYSYGTPTDYVNSGLKSKTIYNATVSNIYFGTINYFTITLHFIGVYEKVIIYYDTDPNFTNGTYVESLIPNYGKTYTSEIFTGLSSNTLYYFKIIPLNTFGEQGYIIRPYPTAKTVSLLVGLNVMWSPIDTSHNYLTMKWTYNGYSRITLFDSSGTFKFTGYGSNQTHYKDTDLIPNRTYSYYVYVYDYNNNYEVSTIYYGYTNPNDTDLNFKQVTNIADIPLGYYLSARRILFTWSSSPFYDQITITNASTASNSVTFSVSGGIYAYDSYMYEGGLLMQNKRYIYRIKLTGNHSNAVTVYTKSFITFGSITNFGIIHSLSTGLRSFPQSYLITESSLPVSFTGIFNGVILNVFDGTHSGNVAIYGLSSGSNAFSYVKTIDSLNSIVTEANKYYGVQIYTINDADNTILSTTAPTYAYTLGKITSFSEYAIIDNSTVLLYWDGSYNSVTLETTTTSDFISDPVFPERYNITDSRTYYVPNLEPNKKYYFRLTPINQPLPTTGDVSGISVTWDVSATTMGKITQFSIGNIIDISSSAISLTWDGSYASVYISVSTDGGITYDTENGVNYNGQYGIVNNLSYANYLYYFQINPINNNGLYSNINTRGVYARTLSKINSFYQYAIVDNSTVLLYWDGSYSSVILDYYTTNDFTKAPVYSEQFFDNTNTHYIYDLQSNKEYNFRLTPINQPTETSGDISGVSQYLTATTIGKIVYFSLGNVNQITSSSIPIVWDGSYSSVYVSVSTDGGLNYDANSGYFFTEKTGFADNLSYSDYTYYFQINPINSEGLYSNINTTGVYAKTLGNITRFSKYAVVDNSAVLLYWDGSYSSVSLEYSTASDFTSAPVTSQRYYNVTPTRLYYVENLESNQKYYFRLTPINQPTATSGDINGVSVTFDVSATTMAEITFFGIGNMSDLSSSAISLTWDGYFSSVAIGVSTDGGNTYDRLPNLYTSKYAVIDLQFSNYRYYFNITPINSEGVYSNITTGNLYATTLSTVSDFSWNFISDFSSVSFYIDGSFSSITIDKSDTTDFYVNPDLTTNFTSHSYTSVSSNKIYVFDKLLSNKKYYFRVRPFNRPTPTSSYIYGYPSNTLEAYTRANITSIITDISNTTSSSIPLLWDGSYNYVVVKISSDGGASYSDASSVLFYSSYSRIITFTELSIFKTYYFRIYPYNDISAVGFYAEKTGTTLGYIGNVYASSITSNGFTVNISDAIISSFNVFNHINNKTYPIVYYPNTSLIMNDLSPNTYYTVTAYGYNYSSTDGCGNPVSVTLSNVKTLGSITGVVNDISSVYYSVSVIGSYTSFKIRYVVDNVTYDTSYLTYGTKVYVYDLQPNIIYNYTVYANNLDNGNGTDVIKSFTVRTLGILASKFYQSQNYADTNSITFNVLQTTYVAIRIITATDSLFSNILYTKDISYDDVVNVYNNSYTQNGLSENTKYYFIAYAIDSSNNETDTSTTLYLSTLGNLYSFGLDTSYNITSNSIPVKWNGTYYKTMIEYATASSSSYYTYGYYNNDTGLASSSRINGNTIVNGLLPNTQYYFRATPLSLDIMSGTSKTITDISAVTLGIITNVNNTSFYDTSASFIIDGSFTQLKVYSSPASLEKYYFYTNGGVNTGNDISGLLYDASYVFYFLPINSIGVSNPINGDANISYTIRTLPKLTNFYLTGISAITSTSIGVTWDGSFDSVQVDYSTDGVIYTTANSQASGYNLIVDGLTSNTRYYFRAIPSKYGVTGSYVYISDTSAITYGYIKTLTASVTDSSAISLNWDGSFNSVNIYTSTTSGLYSSSPISLTGYSTLISDLSPNTIYYFKAVAINNTGISNVFVQNVTGLTYGYMNSLEATPIDISSIEVSWGGSFNSVNLYYSLTEGTYSLANSFTYTGINSAVIRNLSPNTRYYYKVSAVNATGEGNITVQDISTVTYGYIKKLTVVPYDSSSIQITWDGSYNTVIFYFNYIPDDYYRRNSVSFPSSIRSTILTGAQPNQLYYYKVVAINDIDLTTVFVENSTVLTYGYMNTLNATPIDISSIQVSWDGSFNSVKLYYSLTQGTYSLANSFTYTGINTAVIRNLLPNTRYYYKVSAVNSSGEGNITVQDISTVTYGYITKLTAIGYDSSSIRVSWDGSFNSVNLYYSLTPNIYTAANLIAYSGGTKTTILRGLEPNKIYYYKVVSVNANGLIGNIVIENANALTYGYIKSLNATPIDISSIQISWDGSYNSVKLYYSLTEGTYSLANSFTYTGINSAVIRNLLPNTRYYYKVSAVNSTGEGNITVQDISTITYGYITKLTATTYDSSSVQVTWDGSFSSVNLYYSLTPNIYTATNLIAYSGGTKTTLLRGLLPNSVYYYKVVSVNANGLIGNIVIENVNALTYGYIKSLNAIPIDISSIQVSWDGSFNSVKLYYNLINGVYTDSYTYTGINSAVIRNLLPNTRYYYKVSAVNATGEGNITVQDISTVTYGYITKLTATTYDSSSVQVTWDGSFSSVNLYYSLTPNIYTATNLIAYSGSTKTALLTRLLPNSVYYYKVVSVNANGLIGNIVIENVNALTYGYIKSLNAIPIDISSIQVSWDGSFNSVKLYYNLINGVYTDSYTYTGINSAVIRNLSPNTRYYYKVSAVNATGENNILIKDISMVTYGYITKLTATTYDSSSIRVSWDGSFNSVNLYYSLTPNDYTSLNLISYSKNTYNALINNLIQNTTYYYKAVSVNDNQLSSNIFIQDISATTLVSFYYYNIGFANVIDNSSITVFWYSNYSSVKIYYSTVKNIFNSEDYVLITNTNNYFNTFNNLLSNTRYYYRIEATDLFGDNYIQDLSALTYSTVTNLLINSYDSSSVKLIWDGSYSSVNIYYTSVDPYIYNSSYTINYNSPPINFTGNTGNIINLQSNLLYFFKAVGVNNTGIGTNVYIKDISVFLFTESYLLTYLLPLTSTITGYGTTFDINTPFIKSLSSSTIDSSSVLLTWDGSFSTMYIYYSKTSVSYNVSNILSYTGNSGIITGLDTNTTYYFKAVPTYKGQIGYITKDISATTLVSSVISVNATPVNYNSIKLTWNTSIYSIDIYYSTTPGTYSGNVISITPNGFYYNKIINNLLPNTIYYFKVLSFDINNNLTNTIQDISALTYPTLTKFSISTYDSSSVSFIWDGSYSSVNVYYNVFSYTKYNTAVTTNYSLSSTVTNFTGSKGIITALDPSYVYYFKAMGVNSTGIGTDIYVQDISALLKPDINVPFLSGITVCTVIYGNI